MRHLMAASQAVPAMMEARSVDVAMVVMEALTVVKWAVHPDSVLGSGALVTESKLVMAVEESSFFGGKLITFLLIESNFVVCLIVLLNNGVFCLREIEKNEDFLDKI